MGRFEKKHEDARPARRSRRPVGNRFGHESREEASWSERENQDQRRQIERDEDDERDQRRRASEPEEPEPRTNGNSHANGKARLLTLNDLDRRTKAYKLATNLIAQLTSDLGREPSTAEHELIQRAAMLGAVCEHSETNWLDGERVDLMTWGALADRQRRMLESLGLRRVPKNISPPNAATRAVLDALRRP